MKINSILSIFTPKDAKFIPMLKETTHVMVKASVLLKELFALPGTEGREELCKLIKEEELKGDVITTRIFKALNETFITPFDREDIATLTDIMDDVIDIINRVSQKVLLYSPGKLPESTFELTKLIHEGTLEVEGAVQELEKLREVNSLFKNHYRKIKKIEEEADSVYEHGIKDLFKSETNTIELIKVKEIIQELEKAANKINNTGKVLKTIFVKYA
jgi:predicted phosphate transport protein (TIGR00153 family)